MLPDIRSKTVPGFRFFVAFWGCAILFLFRMRGFHKRRTLTAWWGLILRSMMVRILRVTNLKI